MSFSYQNRLNQLEELDAADLEVLDALHDVGKKNKAVEVYAEEVLAVERVIQTLAQLHRNERSRANRAEQRLTEREIELGEEDDAKGRTVHRPGRLFHN